MNYSLELHFPCSKFTVTSCMNLHSKYMFRQDYNLIRHFDYDDDINNNPFT